MIMPTAKYPAMVCRRNSLAPSPPKKAAAKTTTMSKKSPLSNSITLSPLEPRRSAPHTSITTIALLWPGPVRRAKADRLLARR